MTAGVPMSSQRPYDGLDPGVILDAVESLGYPVDGRLLSLNSYENRVYQVGVEEATPVVVKFYRPGRWSDQAILEEHRFALDLAGQDIPVVPPLRFDGESLVHFGGFRLAVFPRQGGREPSLESAENLQWMGRLLGRMHAVGRNTDFSERPRLLDFSRIQLSVNFLVEGDFIPFDLGARYRQVANVLLPLIEQVFAEVGHVAQGAIHGDCHRGNVLWTDDGPHIVDLDDCLIGPAVQDFWMLLDGDRETRERQLQDLLDGYRQFMSFDPLELRLIEALRARRMVEYAAWIARRWDDPAFPRVFPWFGQARYWEEHIGDLAQQIEAMQEAPLTIH